MTAWRPGDRIDRFQIVGFLAAGGMAEIYVADLVMARGLTRRVALKRVRPDFADDAEFAAMFFEEARVAAQLSHPSLVGVVDAIEHDGLVLVQDYVPGWDLAALLESGPLPVEAAVHVLRGVAEALAALHAATDAAGRPLGIVHRDLSPSNVLIGSDGSVRLLDFGIAKAALGGRKTAARAIKGKLAYMAPEQARGLAVDARTDLYALGLTAFETLTGARALDGEDDRAMLAAAREPTHRPPSLLEPAIPAALDELVRLCLSVDPSARPADADEVAEALDRLPIGGLTGRQVRALLVERRGAAAREVVTPSVTDRWLGRLLDAVVPTRAGRTAKD